MVEKPEKEHREKGLGFKLEAVGSCQRRQQWFARHTFQAFFCPPQVGMSQDRIQLFVFATHRLKRFECLLQAPFRRPPTSLAVEVHSYSIVVAVFLVYPQRVGGVEEQSSELPSLRRAQSAQDPGHLGGDSLLPFGELLVEPLAAEAKRPSFVLVPWSPGSQAIMANESEEPVAEPTIRPRQA